MKSWVRYSVAVYVGLLIAGLTGAPPQTTEADSGDSPSMPLFDRSERTGRAWHHPGEEIRMEVETNGRELPSWLED